MLSIHRLTAIAAVLLTGLAGLGSPALAAPAKVTIGFPPATDFLAAYVAKDGGFFAQHDIDAKMTLIPVVNDIPSAIVSGRSRSACPPFRPFCRRSTAAWT